MNCYVEPQKLQGVDVTIMDVSNVKSVLHVFHINVCLCIFSYNNVINELAHEKERSAMLVKIICKLIKLQSIRQVKIIQCKMFTIVLKEMPSVL